MGQVELTATRCPGCGKPYGPGLVNFSWIPCGCEGATRRGHHQALCQQCGHVHLPDHVGPPPPLAYMPPLGRHG